MKTKYEVIISPRPIRITTSFFDDTKGELEYVKAGDQPIKFRNGWDHPRWDDDAMAFSVRRYREKGT